MHWYPHTIYLKFYLPNTWWEKVIAWGSKGKFCHVGFAFSNNTGMWYWCDMQSRGFSMTNGTGPHSDHVVAIPTRGAAIFPWVMKHAGERYGWLDLFIIATRKWLPRKLGGNPNGLVCSEMVAAMLDELGIVDISNIQLTPTELYEKVGNI